MDTDKNPPKKESGFTGKTFRNYVCPNCTKQRMLREDGHTVSIEKHTASLPDGTELEHFTDVCDPCAKKISRLLTKKHSVAQMRKVLKALGNDADLGDKSLEDLL